MRGKQYIRPAFYGVLFAFLALFFFRDYLPASAQGAMIKVAGGRTVYNVITDIGPQKRLIWNDRLNPAGLKYPPDQLWFLVFKHEKKMEVWGDSKNIAPKRLHVYDILAASGGPGPKLAEGDLQVPEGVYSLIAFNPNSSFHLSMKIDYPGKFDRRKAKKEGRSNLGGDIFIHGKDVSIGCLAMGDRAIEELFVLVHDVGLAQVKVVIAPYDFRDPQPKGFQYPKHPMWIVQLYQRIYTEIMNVSYH